MCGLSPGLRNNCRFRAPIAQALQRWILGHVAQRGWR